MLHKRVIQMYTSPPIYANLPLYKLGKNFFQTIKVSEFNLINLLHHRLSFYIHQKILVSTINNKNEQRENKKPAFSIFNFRVIRFKIDYLVSEIC